MKLPLPIRLCALLPLLFLAPATRAETDALFFARDADTEMTLTPSGGDNRSWELHLRPYQSPSDPQDFGFSGTLTPEGDDLQCVDERDGKQVTVRLKGDPRAESLTVETTGLQSTARPGGKFDGRYQRLSADEQIARAKARFTAADAILNSTYQTVRAEAGKKANALRELQRNWIGHRDHMAEFGHGDKPEETFGYWDSMLELTIARIHFLPLFNGRDVPEGLSGSYTDGHSGELQLDEKDGDTVEFSISVVRGPSYHTGDLSGTARRKGAKLFYKEEVEPGEEREPAELTFTFSDGHIIEIEGKNTEHHHGARAYFDGTYYKSHPRPSE